MAIAVIHTGGTIGMVRGPRGFAPSEGVVETCLDDLKRSGELREVVELHRLAPQIDSAQATQDDWNRIARLIAARHDGVDGFVVTHGTDTMAYTAAALCFALEGLDRPVILTGAMLPLTEAGSDGRRNLSDALDAACLAPAGVWVQFAGRRLHGARVRKTHSAAFDAFADTWAAMQPRVASPAMRRHDFARPEVAVLTMAPGVSPRAVRAVLDHCDGVVLRCFGSGTVPEMAELRAGLLAAQARGAPVVAVSQCAEGRIAMGTYAAGALLIEAGVIDGRDMTVEAAYAKLHHALAAETTVSGQRARLSRILCGEATA